MPRGKNLQEMDAKNPQSKSSVNANAQPGDPMQHLTTGGQSTDWEDLGGPTPENYRSDDDSAKLKDPAGRLSSVKNVVNKGAQSGDPMPHLAKGAVKESLEDDEDSELDEEVEELDEQEDLETEDEDEDEVLEDEPELEDFSVEEDVNALLDGENLSEEFQEKAKTIFEAALKTRAAQLKEALEAQYEQALIEEVEAIKEDLEERVDAYLEYVAEEWLEENRLQVETGIKVKVTESFLEGLKNLCEQHYVEMPEEKYDVLEGMVEKLDEMEEKLNEQIEKNIRLNQRLIESVADRVLEEVSEGLAVTQKEKLATLSESVEFEGEASYREKLTTLRESYFPTRRASKPADSEMLTEDYISPEYHSDTMYRYLQAAEMVRKN